MNKNAYIKPACIVYTISYNESILAASPGQIGPEDKNDTEDTDYGGEFNGAGAKDNTLWEDDWN